MYGLHDAEFGVLFPIYCSCLAGVHVASQLKHCEATVGAACHSHLSRASPMLLACGVPEELAMNALRISIGRGTSKEDIDVFVADLKNALESLRKT